MRLIVLGLICADVGGQVNPFAGPANEGSVELVHLQVPNRALISAFEIDMDAARVNAVRGIASGWDIRVVNHVGGKATIVAEADGSTLLSEAELEAMGFEIVRQGALSQPLRALGNYTYELGAAQKRVPLGDYNFVFIEKYPRHRLAPQF